MAAERLVLLTGAVDVVYPNGDHCQFISMTFRCRYLRGEAHVADEESTEVRWFGLAELPQLSALHRRRIECGLASTGPTVFDI